MTTPTGPIVGTASVAITPSTATFTPQLQAALQRAVVAVSNAADDMGDAIAREITSGVARAQLALRTLGDGLNERLTNTTRIMETVVGGLLHVGMNATKVGAALGALGLAAGNAAFAFGALLGAASELSGIAVALPAVIGSAALVMGTLKIATEGVGDAMGAALSGDMEKFSEAMKDLSPSAQAAANTVAQLAPRIDKLKTAVQENFFQQLSKSFGDFAIQATKVAETGLPRIATELGKIGGEFFTTATKSGTFFTGVQALIDQTVGGLQRWKGVMPEVANALGNLFQVGSGFAGDLIGGVGNLIAQFATWINTASQTGELQARLQTAIDAFATLGRIVGNLAHIFGAFWFSAQESGANFLGVIENLTASFATFLNSDFGIASLTALMDAGATAAAILGDAVGAMLPVLGQLVMTLSVALVGALETIRPALDILIGNIGLFAEAASGGVSNAIGIIAGVLANLMIAIAPLLPAIGQLVSILAEHFAVVLQTIAPLVVEFLNALLPMLPIISELASSVLTAFVEALSAIFTAIKPLIPVLIQLAVKVLTLVAEHFINIFEAVEPLIPVIIDLVEQGFQILAQVLPVVMGVLGPLLPIIMDLAKEIGGALAPVLPAIAEAFREIFTQLRPVLPQLAELAGTILVTLAQLFTALVKAVAPLLPPLIQIGTEILAVLMPAFNQLLEAIIPLLPIISDLAVRLLRESLLPILEALLPVMPVLVDALIQLLPAFVDLLIPIADLVITLTPIIVLLTQLAALIIEVVVPVLVLFTTVVNELRAIAITLLGAAIDALVVIVKVAWDAIATAIQIAWLIIKGIFDIMISLLQGDFSEAWRRLETLIKDIWNRLKTFISDTISTITNYFVEWGTKLYTAAKNALQRILDAASEIFGGFIGAIGTFLVDVIKELGNLSFRLGLFFMGAGKWLYNAGKDIVMGLLNGMADIAKGIGNWVNDNIVNPIKNAVSSVIGFDFGSPSKWMKKRGKWVVQGLATGMEDETGTAMSATTELITAVKSPIDAMATGMDIDIASMLRGSTLTSGTGAVAGAQTSSVVFGQGSVVVSFEGVVPSEADALRTGQAVGRGIADVMAQRDTRLAVRVM